MPEAKYLRALFGAAREHGLTKQDLNDAAMVGFQKSSLRDLTDDEVKILLDGIRGKKRRRGKSGHTDTARGYAMGTQGKRRGDDSTREFLVTEKDLNLLADAAALRGWSRDTLDTFIRRQLRGRSIRTIKELNKVLWAVKAMNRRDKLVGSYDVPRPQARPE